MRRGSDKTQNLDLFELLENKNLWKKRTDSLSEETIVWTDEEIAHISDSLLEDSLRNLFDGRCSPKTVDEIYKWMMDDKDPNPFSFVNCCQVSGLDPDDMRGTVLFKLKIEAKRSQSKKLH